MTKCRPMTETQKRIYRFIRDNGAVTWRHISASVLGRESLNEIDRKGVMSHVSCIRRCLEGSAMNVTSEQRDGAIYYMIGKYRRPAQVERPVQGMDILTPDSEKLKRMAGIRRFDAALKRFGTEAFA